MRYGRVNVVVDQSAVPELVPLPHDETRQHESKKMFV